VASRFTSKSPSHFCQEVKTGRATIPLTSHPNTVSFDLPGIPRLNETESHSAYFVLLFPNIAPWMFPHHLITQLDTQTNVLSSRTVSSAPARGASAVAAIPDTTLVMLWSIFARCPQVAPSAIVI